MFSRIEGGDEMFTVKMLGRCDQHRIDALILQQVPVVEICPGIWR
jgi:hypothetical protein